MTAKTDVYNLQNYIKLTDVVSKTWQQLRNNETVISNKSQIKNFNQRKQILLSFNTLIATGYNAITVLNDDELIKTNFDFASNNTDVLLDFNYDELTKLVNTNAGDKQEKLI